MQTRVRPYIRDFVDWRSWTVFRRNAQVYFRNWRTAFLPPAMEPVIFFLAFGLGLGAYIGYLLYHGQEVSYPTYVAPGMIAYTAFNTPFFEGLYASYVRMFYQKTWDGILATQVELHHIVWGEIFWCGARGMMNSAVVAIVLAGFTLTGFIDIHLWALLLAPLVGFVAGWAFGAFALIFTAIVPSIDHMNYPVFLIGIPLGLVSNTYFPVHSDILAVQIVVNINPVYHLSETLRGLMVAGTLNTHLLWLVVSSGGLLLICVTVAQTLMRRRVLGEE